MMTVKDNGKILKITKQKMTCYLYKETPIRLTADFSADKTEAKGSEITYSKCVKKKNCQPRSLYPSRLCFKEWR